MAAPERADPVVLITGASGLIGTRTAKALGDGYRVIGLDVVEPEGGAFEFIECDLTSAEGVEAALRRVRELAGNRLASVIHLAAYYDFSGEPSPLYDELTVEGSRRLVRGLRAFEVEQFVFSSSLLVMEPVESTDEVLTEASPVRAEWEYPQSKVDAEAAIEGERGDLPVVILRLAGAYDEMGHSPPITQQIRRIREKKLESRFFPGDLSHGQSFVHLDDVAECLRLVVERRGHLGEREVFLIGEPEVLSYGELQDRIGELIHGKEWTTIRVPESVAKAGAWVKEKLPTDEDPFIKPWMIDIADAHYPVSIERARRRLGWEPRRTLGGTLPEMIAHLERDPRAFYEENGLPLPDDLRDEEEGS